MKKSLRIFLLLLISLQAVVSCGNKGSSLSKKTAITPIRDAGVPTNSQIPQYPNQYTPPSNNSTPVVINTPNQPVNSINNGVFQCDPQLIPAIDRIRVSIPLFRNQFSTLQYQADLNNNIGFNGLSEACKTLQMKAQNINSCQYSSPQVGSTLMDLNQLREYCRVNTNMFDTAAKPTDLELDQLDQILDDSLIGHAKVHIIDFEKTTHSLLQYGGWGDTQFNIIPLTTCKIRVIGSHRIKHTDVDFKLGAVDVYTNYKEQKLLFLVPIGKSLKTTFNLKFNSITNPHVDLNVQCSYSIFKRKADENGEVIEPSVGMFNYVMRNLMNMTVDLPEEDQAKARREHRKNRPQDEDEREQASNRSGRRG